MLILAYFLMFLSFCALDDFFRFSTKIGFRGILGPPSYGIGATFRIGQEMLCLPYAGFFFIKNTGQNNPTMKISAKISFNVFSLDFLETVIINLLSFVLFCATLLH